MRNLPLRWCLQFVFLNALRPERGKSSRAAFIRTRSGPRARSASAIPGCLLAILFWRSFRRDDKRKPET